MTDRATPDELPIDETALHDFLTERFGSADRYEVRPLAGGAANETLIVNWNDREMVLRRPPDEESAPDLHGVLREYPVIEALGETWVPVPEPIIRCQDSAVLGSEFYLMEYLDGEFLPDGVPERFATRRRRQQVGEAIVDTLAKIHAIDYTALDLDTPNDPANYNRGEVDSWVTHLETVRETTADVRPVPALDAVAEWLRRNVPADHETTLVHGDYKPDNLMFAPGLPPRLVAVLDWEMHALGDPLADLGWLLTYWSEPRDPEPRSRRYMEADGFPTRRELVARYERNTGRTYTDDRFYRTIGVFKLAAICEGFYALHLTDSPSRKPIHAEMDELVPMLATRAQQIIDGEVPL